MARGWRLGERPLDWIGSSIVEAYYGNAYRAVYTVRFAEVAYVLHAFQKKSPKGVKTAAIDIELVARRLKLAQLDYEERYGETKE